MAATHEPATRGAGIGAYYTPPAVVDFMCREALAAWLSGDGGIARDAATDLAGGRGAAALAVYQARWVRERLRALRAIDPACGRGAFLEGLLRAVAQVWGAVGDRLAPAGHAAGPIPETWHAAHGLVGIELDPDAAKAARRRVAAEAVALGVAPESARDAARIRVGDALAASRSARERGATSEFDIVLINPPYENMVAMKARSSEHRRRLRETYATARRGFDLFVPFIERSLEMLAPGGILAALTPDKLLSAAYAEPLRERYREQVDLLAMADLTGARPFAAGVYPIVTIGRRRRRGGRGEPGDVRIYRAAGHEIRFAHDAPASVLERAGNHWAALFDPECDAVTRALAGLPRLVELAEVHGAATVAEAYAWRPAIVDDGRRLWQRDPERYAPFIVSGNIAPGAHTWGARPVRYLGRSYREPVLDTRHAAVSERRRRQVRRGKVILSGLARRPTCVWDPGGLAAGKSTVLVIPRDGVRGEDLAAAINSDETARIYRLLFGALSLSGGYLRFGPPQMRALPVRRPL